MKSFPLHISCLAFLGTFALSPLTTAAAEPAAAPPSPTVSNVDQNEDEDTPVLETVVTATRLARPTREVPTAVTVIPRSELALSPARTMDSVLRTLPSVGTFRRTPSLTADPSSQGLNLRGVGPSAVSRSLVLMDGVPVNSPFGGWIYWRSLPTLGVERVEVAPGAGSALYGNAALGGVVQLFSRRIEAGRLELEASGGTLEGRQLAGYAAERWGKVSASLEGEWLATDGYVPVLPERRGAVDVGARSRHGTALARVEYQPTDSFTTWARLGFFDERQNGGTQFTTADVRLWQASLGARSLLGRAGQLDATLFARTERFDQERARIAAERSLESLSARQRVPAEDIGGAVGWTSPSLQAGGRHQLSGGLDLRRVWGVSRETVFPAAVNPASVVGRRSGGEQWFGGVFLQDLYSPTESLFLTGAVRMDGWRNREGHRVTERAELPAESTTFAPRTESQLSPRLGALWRPWEPLALRVMGARAFRAPTLNELYRPFQVGTVLTAANEQLGPERLWELESGVDLTAWKGGLLRVTGFWNRLESPIANVTLESEPGAPRQRQRQNLGHAVIQGVETSAQARLGRDWTLLAGYTYVDARVKRAPNQLELEGKRLPQVPMHRVSGAVAFANARLFRALLQVQWLGDQYEDDLNSLPMGGYAVVDASFSRNLWGPVELFASGENLLGKQYLVGRAGVDTIGPPRTFWLGLRLTLEETATPST